MPNSIPRVLDRMREEYALANYRRNALVTQAALHSTKSDELLAHADDEDSVAKEIRRALLAYGFDPQEG